MSSKPRRPTPATAYLPVGRYQVKVMRCFYRTRNGLNAHEVEIERTSNKDYPVGAIVGACFVDIESPCSAQAREGDRIVLGVYSETAPSGRPFVHTRLLYGPLARCGKEKIAAPLTCDDCSSPLIEGECGSKVW